MTDTDQLLTTKEAAMYLRVHEQTLYAWRRDGKIPAERLGYSLRFRKTDLDAWLKREQPSQPSSTAA